MTNRDWLVGIDVGGTFTDGVLVRPDAEPLAVKSPTRVDDPVAGLLGCVDRLAERAGCDRGDLLRRTAKFGYGTTQAANMIVEGTGARTGFITTRGFRDTLVIAGIERAGQNLNTVNIPPEITKILAGVLVLSAVITYEVVLRLTQAATVREAAHRAHTQLPGNTPTDQAVAAK